VENLNAILNYVLPQALNIFGDMQQSIYIGLGTQKKETTGKQQYKQLMVYYLEMNNITTSLEVSKRLKEAGWENKSYFGWIQYQPEKREEEENWYLDRIGKYKLEHLYYWTLAPTVSEILDVLPDGVHVGDANTGFHGGLTIRRRDDKWIVSYESNGHKGFPCDTIADAAAEMWIYLKENDLLQK